MKNPREAAFLAMVASIKGESFVDDALEQWRRKASPSAIDFHLAQRLAHGTTQMALALDYLAMQLADKKKLSLKPKERLLVRLALYQYYYTERIPLYAITNEMVSLAKKHCHRLFANFLNAILQKLSKSTLTLPQGDTSENLSIRYSYPPFYVDKLLAKYGLDRTKDILTAGNKPAPVMVRLRTDVLPPKGTTLISESPCRVAVVEDNSRIPVLAKSSDYYIQNVTPATLLSKMCLNYKGSPKRILDLCASPGGKLLIAHDGFPKAKLYGNDISPDKIERLSENLSKYGVNATLSCSPGEVFIAPDLFDIIILDVPCSNSGVLNKRSEARWRLSEATQNDLKRLQYSLLEHAASILASDGEIWYLTCSILPDENEEQVSKACQKLGLQVKHQETILPNAEGWDGGFGCSLREKNSLS